MVLNCGHGHSFVPFLDIGGNSSGCNQGPFSKTLILRGNFEISKVFFSIQGVEGSEYSNSKRSKPNEGNENGQVKVEEESKAEEEKQSKSNSKPPEPPKDYIHVRARRGQATDSHSLAERVRIKCFWFLLMTLCTKTICSFHVDILLTLK